MIRVIKIRPMPAIGAWFKRRLVPVWRRSNRRLDRLSDHLLRDIGLDSDQAR
ncbi:MAG: DUF1127 domain-containing protein [Pseudomonadota bacterium]